MISEDIPRPGKLAWLRRDFKLGFEYLLVLIVAWTQHDSVLAECDRLPIVVGRNVPDSENRHGSSTRMRPKTCNFCASDRTRGCGSMLSLFHQRSADEHPGSRPSPRSPSQRQDAGQDHASKPT